MESKRENGKEMVREWGNEKMEREREWGKLREVEKWRERFTPSPCLLFLTIASPFSHSPAIFSIYLLISLSPFYLSFSISSPFLHSLAIFALYLLIFSLSIFSFFLYFLIFSLHMFSFSRHFLSLSPFPNLFSIFSFKFQTLS